MLGTCYDKTFGIIKAGNLVTFECMLPALTGVFAPLR